MPEESEDLDQALDSLSREKGFLVYGVLWSAGRPFLIHEDPQAPLGIEA